ncbi:MAG TPA: sugar ABC transporter permease [Spirochaetia bacterium]|nr:sugar ABC transporter permease [Spirochaetia bacterium]
MKRKASRLVRTEQRWFYLVVSPWILGFLAFVLFPMIASLYFSFTAYDVLSPPRWVGAANFVRLFGDNIFWKSVLVTFEFAFGSVATSILFGLLLAVILNARFHAVGFARVVIYMPQVLPIAAVSVLWLWLLNPQYGIINFVLGLVGISGPNWLGSEGLVVPSLVLINLWGVGGVAILLLAGLQGIPHELYEAALLDGAGSWITFTRITVPMLSPVIFFNVVIGIINGLQVFVQPYIMTGGGPNYASYFYNLSLYNNAFQNFRLGLASAQGWILFVITSLLTYVIFRGGQRYVYYEGSRT